MITRRRKAAPKIEDWVEEREVTINRHHVRPGTELTIAGHRGRVRFVKKVTRPARGVSWIDVADDEGHIRSFREEAVKRVHRNVTTTKNLLEARKKYNNI